MENERRLELWDRLEEEAASLKAKMDEIATSEHWRDDDVQAWDELYTALTDRPRLPLAKRDAWKSR